MSLGTKMVLHSLFKFKTRRSLPFMGSPKTISILLVVLKELQGIMMVLNYDGVKKVYVGLAQDGIPVVKFVYHKGAVEIIGTEHGKSTLLGFEEVLISMELVDYYCKEAAQPWNPNEEVQFSNYGNQPQLISDIKPWLEVGEVNGLPYILEEKYKTAKTVLLGVFPEIRGTWAILDHSLTVWTYGTINVPIYYFPLDDKPVLAVGLVKPRPGFVEDARYLLLYATTLELHLSKVCCAEDGQHIKALVDYTTSLEGLTVTCILGTDGGRIFLAGQDCYMYELFYAIDEPCRLVCCTQNAPSNFFSRFKLGAVDDPVVEMVFDSQRKTLYTRTKKAKLEAYFLGMNGDSPIEKVGEVWNLYYAPSVVSISPLSKLESKWSHAHLVALLSDGSRRYFSTSSSGNGWKGSPDCLRFITTKPPPTTDVSVDMKGELAYCSGGTLFLSLPSPDHISSTSVIVVAKDSSSRTQVGGTSTLRELGCTIRINGRMLFAAEVLPTPDATSTMLSLYSQVLGESYENTCVILRGRGDLLTQHLLPKKKIFVVSTTAMAELFFNRPVDILYSILNSSKMSRVSLNAFVDHFGADETADMLLMLASGIMFGAGELDSLVSTRAADLFEGMKMEIMPQLDATMVQDEISHSAAHKGLYLCTSRLLYPIWNSCLLSKSSSSDSMSEDGVLSCRFFTEAMHELQRKLRSLGNYLTRNSDAQDSSGGEVANVRQGLPDGHYNVSKDVPSMECCRHLILRSAEALFLLQILSRHDIAIFTRECEESLRRTLLQLEFRQLVHPVEDNQIAKVLIFATMERNPFGDDSTRDILLGGCPSYSNEAFLSPRDCTVGISSQQVIRKRVNTGKV